MAWPCKGVLNGRPCVMGKRGKAISMRYPCADCREWRCRSHCKCARSGHAVGRKAPRPNAKARAAAKALAAPAAAVVVPPVGRPAPLSFQLLAVSVWYAQMLTEVRGAGEIVLASMLFDHTALCAALLARLGQRTAFTLTVLVDAQAFKQRTALNQRPRLDSLRRAGALVYLCRGRVPRGIFHIKALVVDRRVGFAGGANFTNKSLQNAELTWRFSGPPVADVLREVEVFRGKGVLWDGRN